MAGCVVFLFGVGVVGFGVLVVWFGGWLASWFGRLVGWLVGLLAVGICLCEMLCWFVVCLFCVVVVKLTGCCKCCVFGCVSVCNQGSGCVFVCS